jgi:hypothetical protein
MWGIDFFVCFSYVIRVKCLFFSNFSDEWYYTSLIHLVDVKKDVEENNDGGVEDGKDKIPGPGKPGKRKRGKKNMNCLFLIFLPVH